MINAPRFKFDWKTAYQGAVDYMVFDRKTGNEFRVAYRTQLNGYAEKHYNGTKEKYRRDVVGSLHYLTIHHIDILPIESFPQLANEFRDHLSKKHKEFIEWAKKQIARIGNDLNIGTIYLTGPASPLVRGCAHWDDGWHMIEGTGPKRKVEKIKL